MRQQGIKAVQRKRFTRTTDSKHELGVVPNELRRDFSVGQVNQKWTGDITYLRTLSGFVYLAAIIDLGTRKWVGYAVASHMRTSLCLEALEMALRHEGRAPRLKHTDRGSQYASEDYRRRLKDKGIVLSMSAKGDCWDNAVSESFFGTLKTELGDTFVDLSDAERELFDYWIFYNRHRRHSTLEFQSPEKYAKGLRQLDRKVA